MNAALALLLFLSSQSAATDHDAKPAPRQVSATASANTADREFFVSWGYNGAEYTTQDMHFSQPGLGNAFTLYGVQVHDSRAWTDLFSHSLFVPQYNIRVGYFFNSRWGFEAALDHIKWIVTQDQTVRQAGTMGSVPVDQPITLATNVLRYQLNNGANPVFFNVIRRFRLAGQPGHTGHVAFLAKAGIGPAVPHTENVLFNEPNEAGFQWFHGWAADVVASARINVFRRVYAEFEDKLIYARYYGVKINEGTAHHAVKANEFTFSLGIGFGR